MILLALGLGVLFLIPVLTEVSSETQSLLNWLGAATWVLFVLEYLLLLYLAPSRRQMFLDHPVELLLILLPVFRPLRALPALRVLVGAGAAFRTITKVAHRTGLQWFGVLAVSIIGLGAVTALWFERREAGAEITDLGDAIWWAIVTCTTVGYGDVVPLSPGGRFVAVVLMVLGIGIVSVVTANVASALVEDDTESDLERLEEKLDSLSAKLDVLIAERGND